MIVLLLGIGYGGYQAINSPSTTTSTVQDDRVTKPAKKKTPAKKTKKSHNKSQSNTATSQSSAVNTRATSQGVAPSSSGTVQSGQSGSAGGHTTTDQPSASPVTPSTVPDTILPRWPTTCQDRRIRLRMTTLCTLTSWKKLKKRVTIQQTKHQIIKIGQRANPASLPFKIIL